MNTRNKIFVLWLLALLFPLGIHGAEIASGKVYRIKNIGKPGYSLSASPSVQGAIGAVSNDSDTRQQWYATANEGGTGFFLQNVSNGAYLQSPHQLYTQWPLVFTSTPDANSMALVFEPYDGNITIRSYTQGGNYPYAHCDGSNNIVDWAASSTPSQWALEEVAMTQAQINEMLARFASTGDEIAKTATYQTYLDNLFTDKACTTLKVSGDLSSNSNYNSLPPVLKKMVDKVMKSDWSETDGDWDSTHAKKYRVQSYEPYSEGSAAASFAGIQAYTNMNNPTGILANAGEIIYVMVNDDIKDGATLYIGGVLDCSMYNNVTSGTKLHKGLNMILCNADNTHYFIYYTVNTVSGKQKLRKVTDFDPVTIHIEGGSLNGFFNYVGDSLYAADTAEDFIYTTSRAKHPMYDMIGKYVILHFYLEDTPNLEGEVPQICVKNAFDKSKNPAARHTDPGLTMKAWDEMCFVERILMGIQDDNDIANSYNRGYYSSILNETLSTGEYSINPTEPYSDYFNNRMMGITYQAAGLYMNATSWRTAYAPGTVSAILSQFPEDGIWGPAHEYGHMNQGPIAIAGTTEESNNIFSNVANYFICRTTSRADYPSDQLKNFSAGNTYLLNGTWGTTRMFWQLWCYYHATKHNTKFYPRLFELLRKYPLKRETTTYPGKLNGKADMLHFVKMCCIASQEDLTNFFASWGFFFPQDTYHIDDYSVYDLILTQEDIDAVKEEIKSWNFPKNDAIILIDDRPGSDLAAGFGYNKDLCGKYGGLKDFENPQPATGNFSFTVDGTNVTVTGTGNPGVGFLIFDNDGNLIGFSNSDSFTLSTEAAAALIAGNATVKAVDANNNSIEVSDPLRGGDLQTKKDLLKALIDRCDTLLALSDETETHVGYLFSKSCIELKDLRNQTYSLWEGASDADLNNLTDAYLELSESYYALLNNPSARIPVVPGSAYRLVNHNYTNRTLDADNEKCVSTTINTSSHAVPFSQQWVLESVEGAENTYFIKNLYSGQYISTTKKQSTTIPLSETPQSYTLLTIEQGVYAFAPDGDTKFGMHIDASNKIVQWNTSSTPTQWTLVKTSTPEIIELRGHLNQKISEANELLASSGEINRMEPKEIVFPESCYYSNAPYTGGGLDGFKDWSVVYDNNPATYFHSNYNNNIDSEDGLDHYIRLESPDNTTFRFFDLSYKTRQVDNINTNPRTIVIEASPDKVEWREVFHASGLPTGNAVDYSTGEIVAPENTKYIRMVVTGASSLAKGHPYFCVSELHVDDMGEPVFVPYEDFPYLKPEGMQKLYDEIKNATLDVAYPSSDLETLKQRVASLESGMTELKAVMIPKVDVSSVAIGVNPIVMKKGSEAVTINATVEPADATFPEFVWSIEDTSVAEIESVDGKSVTVQPKAMGQTVLSVSVVGCPLAVSSAVVKVLPEIPVESVVLLPAQLSVPINAETINIVAELYPENATIADLEWTSSDPSIAEVDKISGKITLVRQGSCDITATSTDGTDIKGTTTLTITNAVAQGLIITPAELTIKAGEEFELNASYIPAEADQPLMIWSSSDENVATVDPTGRIKGMAVGSAVITVKADINGEVISAQSVVTVVPPTIKSVSLSEMNLTLEQGKTTALSAAILPSAAEVDLVWTVDNPDVLGMTIASDGLSATLKALAPGTTAVNVVSAADETVNASCIVTVPEISVEEIRFANSEFTLNLAEGGKIFGVNIYPADAPTPRLIWSVDDESVLTLNPVSPLECEVIPLSNGIAIVTVAHADRPEICVSQGFEVTGVSGLANLFEDKGTLVNVYELTGQIVKLNVKVKDLNKLQPGIYIIQQGKISKEVIVR